jgi:hypothetical protein
MTYYPANKFPHACIGPCQRCEHEDAAERIAIQTEGESMTEDVWQLAVEFEKARRRPGQLELGV